MFVEDTPPSHCRICNAPFAKSYTLREMMFGLRDQFEYLACSDCGCLQIAVMPGQLDKYYPPYYYAFTQKIAALKRQPLTKRLLSGPRLKKLYKRNRAVVKYLKPANVAMHDHILDVGCGSGQLICDLFNIGFEHIEGVDKFIPEEINYGYGVKVMKKELDELPEKTYDFIMMNHVLEHMDKQQEMLRNCHALLKDDGCLMIRIPVLGAAWEIYREHWVQLDAPRHFFLHTLKSMAVLAKETGFEIRNTLFDSISFQFWASELYKRDIPLFSEENNYAAYPYETLFTETELRAFEDRAARLNAEEKGDMAAFYLYKV